ncbi:MAG: hypothetical protein ABEJ23_00540 [Haloarculaceae archaeon]
MRSAALLVGLLCALLAAPAVAAPTPTDTPTATATATPDPGATAVVFYDQEQADDSLVVAQANLSAGGFVVAFDGSANGTRLGTSAYLVPGRFENVEVDPTAGAVNGTTVVVLYRDVDGDRTFDPSTDEPYTRDGHVVSDSAYVTARDSPEPTTATVTVATPTATEPATTTPSPARTTAVESEAPGFGVHAALAALLTGAAIYRWRGRG